MIFLRLKLDKKVQISIFASLAQLVEQLFRKQQVGGSNPLRGSGVITKINAEVAQSVEHQLPKLRVAGSSPVFRSK